MSGLTLSVSYKSNAKERPVPLSPLLLLSPAEVRPKRSYPGMKIN